MFRFSKVMARSAWVTAWLAGSSGFCLSNGFFFFFFLICVFFPVGFWWAVVVWWAWWRRRGGDWAVKAQ